MDSRFKEIFSSVANQISKVVFYPDRIYHAAYLNATRSHRYRYNVQEVRSYADIIVLKGTVYLDEVLISDFLRIEYRAGRLLEAAREQGRLLKAEVAAEITLFTEKAVFGPSNIKLHWDPWVGSYQVELWSNLEPPIHQRHDYRVISLMGYDGQITRILALSPALEDVRKINAVQLRFCEPSREVPSGHDIPNPARDDNYNRSHQEPRNPEPSSPENTIHDDNYLLDFRRSWYTESSRIRPVRYLNAMMDAENEHSRPDNLMEMRWIMQKELGGTNVFFHEVTMPPGSMEGAHQHIGSEELYYVTEGAGLAFIRKGDDPDITDEQTIELDVLGIGKRVFNSISVSPGSVIFTKSGGMHGMQNNTDKPLKFVAFLYHT